MDEMDDLIFLRYRERAHQVRDQVKLLVRSIAEDLGLPGGLEVEVYHTAASAREILYWVDYGDTSVLVHTMRQAWDQDWTDEAKRELESRVHTFELIRTRTTIPVPTVYRHSSDENGDTGGPMTLPYYAMGPIPTSRNVEEL